MGWSTHRTTLQSELHDDLAFKEGWQQWVGSARHDIMNRAIKSKSEFREGRERAGLLPGPTA